MEPIEVSHTAGFFCGVMEQRKVVAAEVGPVVVHLEGVVIFFILPYYYFFTILNIQSLGRMLDFNSLKRIVFTIIDKPFTLCRMNTRSVFFWH